MLVENKVTWNEFKQQVCNQKDPTDWIFRGHASASWNLESTLYRFSKKQVKAIFAKEYYQILHNVLSDKQVKEHPDFKNLILPDRSPFIVSLLVANDQHEEVFKNVFRLMIDLRHLGFPSPLLDWTRDPYMAAFFALSNIEENGCIAILRFKRITEATELFGLHIVDSDFYFPPTNDSRHDRQKSIYTLAIRHEYEDTLIAKEKRKGPIFYLGMYDDLELPIMKIEKYIIIDSEENRLDFLRELYDDGYSFEKIYGSS